MTEITFNYNGIDYRAEYEIFGDTLVAHLPDGTTRETSLRGLAPDSAAMTHLRAFVHSLSKKIDT